MPPAVTLPENFLGLLVTCALKGTMFLLLVGILALFCASASRRHFIWMCGFALLGALLVLEPLVPQWGILPNWQASGWMASLKPWIFPVWSLGAALFCAKVILGLVALMRIERRSTELDGEPWDGLLDSCREDLGIRRPVRLLKFPGRIMPMTWGVLRNCVVLPSSAVRWSAHRIRAVLMHELAHIRRRDYLASLLRDAVCAFYWFHPLVWWAAREMDEDREEASDDAVIAAGERPGDYAEHLTTVATRGWGARLVDPQVRPKVALAEKPLIVRVRSILAPWKSRHPITWGQRLQLSGVMVCLLSLVLFVGPEDRAALGLASTSGADSIENRAMALPPSPAPAGVSGAQSVDLALPVSRIHELGPVEVVPGWKLRPLGIAAPDSAGTAARENLGEAESSESARTGDREREANGLLVGAGETSASGDSEEIASVAAGATFGTRPADPRGVVAPPNEYSTSPPDEADEAVDALDIGEVMASFENVGHVDLDEFDLGDLADSGGLLDSFEFSFEPGTIGEGEFSIASLGSPKATELVKGPEEDDHSQPANLEKSRGVAANQRLSTVKNPILPELPAAAQNRPDAGLDVHVFFLVSNSTGEKHLAIAYSKRPGTPTAKYRFEASPDLTSGSWNYASELFKFAGVGTFRDKIGVFIVLDEPVTKSPYHYLRIRSSKSVSPGRDEG